ncbi:MAG: HRDC domain-containing protein, partial [Bacteroidales bacterium]|nr:HRDC domain-containing protein [Bacteroidales bacterium]
HHDIPKSMEGYYQETGRAGRDDGEGNCITFYSYDDILKLKKFMKDKHVAQQEIAKELLFETVAYAESSVCRHKLLLHYFGEVYNKPNCGACDNCLHPKEKFEGKDNIKLVLETILAVKQQNKTKHIINILIGKATSDIKTSKHNILEEFGKGGEFDEKFWNAVIRQSLIERFLIKDIENYGILKVTSEGNKFLKKPYSVMLTKDHDYEKLDDDDFYVAGVAHKTSTTDQTLFALLKDLRKDLSRKEKLPPFVIFQDPSLEDMAIQYPITLLELEQITGVGKGKAEKHGEPFLSLIKNYVDENEIIRPMDMVVKSVVNKSGLKVHIIKNIDRKLPLEDIAHAKGLTVSELLSEIESIVSAGTKINIDYYVNEYIDPYHQEEIFEFFREAQSDSTSEALSELGEDEYSEEEIRMIRIKFISEFGN